jgi:hypothetical protein
MVIQSISSSYIYIYYIVRINKDENNQLLSPSKLVHHLEKRIIYSETPIQCFDEVDLIFTIWLSIGIFKQP